MTTPTLTERLRKEANNSDHYFTARCLFYDAADEIDRLTAALAARDVLECDLSNAAKSVRYRATMLRDAPGWGVHADDLESLAARLEAAIRKEGGE